MTTEQQTEKRLAELKKLSKEQLIELSNQLISNHERQYFRTRSCEQDAHTSFYMMTGGFSSIKSHFSITDNTK